MKPILTLSVTAGVKESLLQPHTLWLILDKHSLLVMTNSQTNAVKYKAPDSAVVCIQGLWFSISLPKFTDTERFPHKSFSCFLSLYFTISDSVTHKCPRLSFIPSPFLSLSLSVSLSRDVVTHLRAVSVSGTCSYLQRVKRKRWACRSAAMFFHWDLCELHKRKLTRL